MRFPTQRLRRLRANTALRNLVRETRLSVEHFIYPLFITFGRQKKIPISSMPGVYQVSVDMLRQEVSEIYRLGIPGVLLFGIPEHKDARGSGAYAPDGVVQTAVQEIKSAYPDLLVITDVCLCEYTDHGHCGIVEQDGSINNDATLELLSRQALSHVHAGCDMVAPSDMMDGRIGYIRKALDAEGFVMTPIMAYAAKFASSFYGPFREAAHSAPAFGDRKTYQMDPANAREALREVRLDIEEGADIVMVKPALAYLDVLRAVKDTFGYPTAAYNVSGEYAMLKAAAQMGWLDEQTAMMEMLTSIKRAGADMIITYFAKDAAMAIGK
ncbi:MAG: porphobilinogen synthase [Desulfobacterota bacterium]|nr:porphobilinogen synthase [Thermodesulfobacteriota bacterium]